ncbi:solute carrier family 23 protein, partial [Staphylococcus aureus]|uniref:solute carrier family 23 protein n=1 Tax=Staphylococcus aureus TaxID=1280 RepID=UPI000AFE91FD
FGATVLAPLLMGFNPNLAILMSGICTILFFLITGGRVPSYLGSSFAFIGVVAAATGHITGSGANPNLSIALGGIVACGIFYALIGFIVMLFGATVLAPLLMGFNPNLAILMSGICTILFFLIT